MQKKKSAPTKQFKKFIPQLVKEELDLIDYSRKNNLYIILDLIYSKDFYFKTKAQREYSFTEIPLSSFKKYLGKAEHVQEDISFLVDSGFVIKNDYYNYLEGRCKGYKIASEYISTQVPVIITNDKINKKIELEMKEIRKRKVKNLDYQKSRYYQNFKIKHEEATEYVVDLIKREIKAHCWKNNIKVSYQEIVDLINCEANFRFIKQLILSKPNASEFLDIMHRYSIYTSQIDKIKEGYLYFKRNATNGRLDTNLTCLPSFLRPFIISNEELVSIDFQNSQPFFLYTAIKDEETIDKTELELYKNVVTSGSTDNTKLYSFLADEYEKTTGKIVNEKQMKKMIFQIFYSRIPSFKKQKDFFSKYFPTINNWINKQKEKDYKDFAIMLQQKEADLILDIIMPRLKEVGIVPYTIHDSFICNESEKDVIVNVIKEAANNLFGCLPNLHIDCISIAENKSNEITDDMFDFLDYTEDDGEDNDINKVIEVIQLKTRDKVEFMNRLKAS